MGLVPIVFERVVNSHPSPDDIRPLENIEQTKPSVEHLPNYTRKGENSVHQVVSGCNLVP